jgi:hypothetical protein
MQLTENFASTAAVTIPVLMLAGAVELRNLADKVTKQTVKVLSDFLIQIYVYEIMTAGERRAIRFIRWLRLRIKMMWGAPEFLPLPSIWTLALLLSAVAEISCFLYLAGWNVGPLLALYCIIVIGILSALLIITPILQTTGVAREAGYRKFQGEEIKDLFVRIHRALPTEEALLRLSHEDREKEIRRLKSIVSDYTSDSLSGRRPYPVTKGTVYRSSPQRSRPPRWARQNRVNRTRDFGNPW